MEQGPIGWEMEHSVNSSDKLINIFGPMKGSFLKGVGGSVGGGDDDDVGCPVDESSFEGESDGISIQDSQPQVEGHPFGSEVVEDGNWLPIVAVEPLTAAVGDPDPIDRIVG